MTDRTRTVPLTNGHNFRDLGGYATAGGKTVAWRRVFRSGTMAELHDSDHSMLEALGLAVICDFRSTTERDRRPSRLPDSVQGRIWSRDYRTSGADLVKALARPGATPALAREMMIALYDEILIEQKGSYRALFDHLAIGRVPILFHCAAGKDRTGVAAALLLDLLGVPRETIFADYTLTNQFVERGMELVRTDPWAWRLRDIDEAIWAPVMDANPAYLETMFRAIDTRYGSTEGYVRDELGLEAQAVGEIRDTLLA